MSLFDTRSSSAREEAMSVLHLPIWHDCPFEVPGLEIRRGLGPGYMDTVAFLDPAKKLHVAMLYESFTPSFVDVALKALTRGTKRRYTRQVRVRG